MIIFDTDIISSFAKLNKLDLLLTLSPKIYITPMIKEELLVPLQNNYDFPLDVFKKSETLIPDSKEMSLFEELRQTSGRGESEAIAIAKQRNLIFITNDKKAYQIAENLGIAVLNLQSLMRTLYLRHTISKEEIIRFFDDLKIEDRFKMSDDYLDSIFSE